MSSRSSMHASMSSRAKSPSDSPRLFASSVSLCSTSGFNATEIIALPRITYAMTTHFTQRNPRSNRRHAAGNRHGRACRGHPRPACGASENKHVGGRNKSGHDEWDGSYSVSGASLRLDVRVPYDPHPFVDLLPHPHLKLGRRVSLGVDAEIGGALGECARIDQGADLGR